MTNKPQNFNLNAAINILIFAKYQIVPNLTLSIVLDIYRVFIVTLHLSFVK